MTTKCGRSFENASDSSDSDDVFSSSFLKYDIKQKSSPAPPMTTAPQSPASAPGESNASSSNVAPGSSNNASPVRENPLHRKIEAFVNAAKSSTVSILIAGDQNARYRTIYCH